MNHKEEQLQEVEALESIFQNELEIIETEPFHVLQFEIKSEKYDSDPDNEAKLVLQFKFTPKYPDEAPEIKIVDSENVNNEDEVIEFLKQQANENVGMAMLYTLVFVMIEKLNKDNELRKEFEVQEKERLERQREEEELKRFEGTKVTVESFLKWKTAFDKEMNELKKQNLDTTNKKTTGKQLFERDESLFTSDLQYMTEEQVEVDESLFQDLDDLDLDDDGEEYVPGEDDDDDEEEEE